MVVSTGSRRVIFFSSKIWTLILGAATILAQVLKFDQTMFHHGLLTIAVITFLFALLALYDLALGTVPFTLPGRKIIAMPSKQLDLNVKAIVLKRRSVFWLWIEAFSWYVFRVSFLVLSLVLLLQLVSRYNFSSLAILDPGWGYWDAFRLIITKWFASAPWLAERVGLDWLLAYVGIRGNEVAVHYSEVRHLIATLLIYGSYAFAITSCGGALVKIGMRRDQLQRRIDGTIGRAESGT